MPSRWATTTLGDVQLDLSKGIDPARTPDDSFELYSVPSHERGAPEVTKGNEIGSNKQTVVPGTVLLCKINPRINRIWVVGNYSSHAKIASTEWIPFFPLSCIEPRYLAYFLRQDTIRDFLAGNASGVGGSLMRVRAATFRDFPFLLAPLTEQAHIADALDELFSDLDAGVAALERVREKLKLYRASVLNTAVEGALTAEWRKQHPHAKPASELLKRILAERRRRWEQNQLRKFKEKGQEPPKNWNAKYKKPVGPDLTNLPSLPEGWCWVTVEQISILVTDGDHNPPKRVSAGVPHLTAKNVKGLKFIFDDCSFISTHDACRVFRRYQPEAGDLVITCVGTVGGLPSFRPILSSAPIETWRPFDSPALVQSSFIFNFF
jgi:type I restriction enzyme S subunit